MALARRVRQAFDRSEYSMLRPDATAGQFFGLGGAGEQEHLPPV